MRFCPCGKELTGRQVKYCSRHCVGVYLYLEVDKTNHPWKKPMFKGGIQHNKKLGIYN